MTIQYRRPVRRLNSQRLTYTFKDEGGVVIPLGGFASAAVELKLQGDDTFRTVTAAIVDPPTAGVVQALGVQFATVGMWTAEFYADDGTGNRLYGEPIQFRVVKNVEDATAAQLLPY